MSVEFENVPIHSDARGLVFEPLEVEHIAPQRNSHVVVSNPGVVRGNHYHLKGTEIIAVVGSALVRIRKNGMVQDIEVPVNEVYRFTIHPGVPHAIKNIGDQPNVLVAFNTCMHDPENPDTVQEILI